MHPSFPTSLGGTKLRSGNSLFSVVVGLRPRRARSRAVGDLRCVVAVEVVALVDEDEVT